MNMGRHTFSPWATNTGKNNRRIFTFHSTVSLDWWHIVSFIVLFIFVNIVHIYKVSIRVRVMVRVR